MEECIRERSREKIPQETYNFAESLTGHLLPSEAEVHLSFI